MHRRRFLRQLAGTSMAAASSSLFATGSVPRTTAAAGANPSPISIRYLTCDARFVDARPCFDPTGQVVLFMRSPIKQPDQVWLYSIPITPASRNPRHCWAPDPFFVDPSLPATRPDWSWSRKSFEIAFSSTSDLYLLDVSTKQALLVDCQASDGIVIDVLSYPSWTSDGNAIVLTNYSEKALQHQRLLGVAVPPTPPDPFTVPCTAVTDPRQVWPGMSSVSPSDPNLVAFAGQAPNLAQTYDQNWNQIWVQNGSDPETSPAMEVNGILGRAPWWSPNGQFIAFESVLTSTDGYNAFYRIWVLPLTVDPPSVGTMQLVTPPDLPVQHAKWSPNGRLIVFAYAIPGAQPVSTPQGEMVPQGIAMADVLSFARTSSDSLGDLFESPDELKHGEGW